MALLLQTNKTSKMKKDTEEVVFLKYICDELEWLLSSEEMAVDNIMGRYILSLQTEIYRKVNQLKTNG